MGKLERKYAIEYIAGGTRGSYQQGCHYILMGETCSRARERLQFFEQKAGIRLSLSFAWPVKDSTYDLFMDDRAGWNDAANEDRRAYQLVRDQEETERTERNRKSTKFMHRVSGLLMILCIWGFLASIGHRGYPFPHNPWLKLIDYETIFADSFFIFLPSLLVWFATKCDI